MTHLTRISPFSSITKLHNKT